MGPILLQDLLIEDILIVKRVIEPNSTHACHLLLACYKIVGRTSVSFASVVFNHLIRLCIEPYITLRLILEDVDVILIKNNLSM